MAEAKLAVMDSGTSDLFQPYGGFPDGVRVEDSRIIVPDIPGIGFEGKSDLVKVMRELAK